MSKQNVKNTKVSVTKIIFTLVNFSMLVLSCYYFKDMPKGILLAAIIVFASLGVIIPSIDSVRHESIYKIFLTISVFTAIALGCFIVLEETGLLSKFTDLEALTEFVRGSKQWGMLVYIAIVIFQVVVLPIPSAIVALIGTALYGATYGFIFMTIGTIVGSVITFFLGRIFGKRLAHWMVGEQNTAKYSDLLNNKGKFFFIIMMLFPFFPDDIICLIAGITTMKFRYFITVVSLTRPIMIAFMCYFGSGTIIPYSGWGIPVWIGLFALTIVLFFVMSKIKNKIFNKKSEKTINIKQPNDSGE